MDEKTGLADKSQWMREGEEDSRDGDTSSSVGGLRKAEWVNSTGRDESNGPVADGKRTMKKSVKNEKTDRVLLLPSPFDQLNPAAQ